MKIFWEFSENSSSRKENRREIEITYIYNYTFQYQHLKYNIFRTIQSEIWNESIRFIQHDDTDKHLIRRDIQHEQKPNNSSQKKKHTPTRIFSYLTKIPDYPLNRFKLSRFSRKGKKSSGRSPINHRPTEVGLMSPFQHSAVLHHPSPIGRS